MEPRPSAQEPHQYHRSDLWTVSCGFTSKASDHVPHITDRFIAYTGNTDLAILLNKDTFELDPMVLAVMEDSTSKSTWGMVLLIVRGLLRRPSLSGAPTLTFCSVHIHNVVAKKRDAPTDLLRRLHGHMQQHHVDFIGGDFYMSAFSTVGDVFSDPECSAPGNSFLWRLGALEEPNRERTGFLIMPKRPCEWIHTAATNTTTLLSALDHVTKLLTFLYFSISAPPTYPAPTASCAVNMRNKESLSAEIRRHERMKRRRA